MITGLNEKNIYEKQGFPDIKSRNNIKDEEFWFVKKIRDKILDAAKLRLTMPDCGFSIDREDKYDFTWDEVISKNTMWFEILSKEDFDEKRRGFRIEIGVEADYSLTEKLTEEFDKVIKEYDKNSYFEMVEPGLIEAYLDFDSSLSKSIKEDKETKNEELNNLTDNIPKRKQRIFFDMDGTLFKWRNIRLNLKEEEETRDIAKIILDILYKDKYFESLPPYLNVIDAANNLNKRNDVEVYILSCVLPDKDNVSPMEQKLRSIIKYLPGIKPENIIFVPDGMDKRNYIPRGIRKDDVLIDDCTEKNLVPWSEKAIGIKVLNGINGTKGTWQGSTINYKDNPDKIVNDILKIAKENTLIRNEKPEFDRSVYDPDLEEDIEINE